MKKTLLAIMLVTVAIGWVSCKKKTTATPADPVYPKGIHAKINGATWNALYVNTSSVTGGGHYTIEFDGPDSLTNETISIDLADFTGRGVHVLSAPSADKAYYSLDTNNVSVPVYATAGQINITALTDSTVGGTFYFTAGSKNITEGTFNVSFN